MYLFVFVTGQSKLVNDNITTADICACKLGTVSIYRFRETVEKLTIGTDIAWVGVEEAKVYSVGDARFHG